MHILLVHNEYGKTSGEEIVVRSLRDLLEAQGHQTTSFIRSSAEIIGRPVGTAKAFFSGVYNPFAAREMTTLLRKSRPDLVHVHNLFPLISPSVLVSCRNERVPVVMTVHNYRLICPNGLHMRHGQICEKCVGGREYHCLLNRCEGSLFKSAGYALRNAVARKLRLFHDNVTLYAALTNFQRLRLISAGFSADRIHVLPNMVRAAPRAPDDTAGEWVGFVGRVSREKGLHVLLRAAAALPHISFKIAGSTGPMPDLPSQAPPNVEFLGHLEPVDLPAFYRRCRMVVLCSTCFEGFPVVLAEANLHGRPVVCSRIGGLPEIVDDQVTGMLFNPGDPDDLAAKIQYLWQRPELSSLMGIAGRAKVLEDYSEQAGYERLMNIYDQAIKLGPAVVTP
ncbi:MAG TPA: glycosyltransferase family 4 protein [Humisphaera sp.]|nr:glycosyltransferase family 4 protein [Humisphaera sp.]